MYIRSNEYFTYDGHQSYLYGLRFAWIDESPEQNMVSEKNYSKIKNAANNNFSVAKSGYDNPLEFSTQIVSDRVISEPEVRRIYSKFFDKNQYKELVVPSETGENIHFNCIITNVEKQEGGLEDKYGVVGFSATIVCDAPWGWTDEKEETFSIENGGIVYKPYSDDSACEATISINNMSDGQDYIYPEVDVVVSSKFVLRTGTNYISRIGNVYSCYGCAYYDKCIGRGDLPDSLTEEQKDILTTQDSIPVKGMVINSSDSQLRGTCFICGYSKQLIKMNPNLGSIVGRYEMETGLTSKVTSTNKKFIRLCPGQNTFRLENIESITFRFREARILV